MDEQVITTLREQEPSEFLIAALRLLIERDTYLLEVDANERSISHRLGLHLQTLLPDWDVDCEYNRDGVDPKRIGFLSLHPDDEDTEAKTVFPDIIVHQRGTDTNHLVIEIKKSSSTINREIDRQKLIGYKRDLHYEYALFIELEVGKQPGVAIVEWI